MARLEVEELQFTYPGSVQPTLKGLSFEVPSGGSLALLGSSGAGKTTLLNLLSGLLLLEHGRIVFDGVDVSKLSAAKRGVAQVFQFPVMYDSLSVRDNIAFPLRTRGVSRAVRRRRAEAVAELFDLGELLDAKPPALSLFQKQLVGFAKALVRDDLPMVLLDEPLTAVEPGMKWRLRGAVKRAQAELDTTMVYVTHDQTEALTFADAVSVLHDGRLLQTASSQELYDRPAHTEVARFIGNPGMNLLPAEQFAEGFEVAGQPVKAAPGDLPKGNLQIGFRPEWGVLETQTVNLTQETQSSRPGSSISIPVKLLGTRLVGANSQQALGIARVAIGESTAQVSCVLGAHLNGELRLRLDRYELFCDNLRVSMGQQMEQK